MLSVFPITTMPTPILFRVRAFLAARRMRVFDMGWLLAKLGPRLDHMAERALLVGFTPEYLGMARTMGTLARKKRQIGQVVVQRIAVQMMHYLSRVKASAKVFLHDVAVQQNMALAYADDQVAIGPHSSTLPERTLQATPVQSGTLAGAPDLFLAAGLETHLAVRADPYAPSGVRTIRGDCHISASYASIPHLTLQVHPEGA